MTLILNPNTKDATTINLSKFHLLIGNRHFSIEDLSGDLVIENLPINENIKSRKPLHVSTQRYKLQIFK
jgi:hypothetical protein|nr:MAG TPA: hypothetical protein [Caudoviricetes sp.]